MNDSEKLFAFAKEVQKMLQLQQVYFKTAKEEHNRRATVEDVRKAFNNSIKQEQRLKKLCQKVLAPQTTLV